MKAKEVSTLCYYCFFMCSVCFIKQGPMSEHFQCNWQLCLVSQYSQFHILIIHNLKLSYRPPLISITLCVPILVLCNILSDSDVCATTHILITMWYNMLIVSIFIYLYLNIFYIYICTHVLCMYYMLPFWWKPTAKKRVGERDYRDYNTTTIWWICCHDNWYKNVMFILSLINDMYAITLHPINNLDSQCNFVKSGSGTVCLTFFSACLN